MSLTARVSFFLVLLASIVFYVGCAGSTPSIDAPAQAAENWYVAVNTMEELEADGLVCKEQREKFREDMAAGSILMLAGNLLLGGDIEIEFDVSEVSFTTVEDHGDAAIVEAKGEARGAVGGIIQSEEVDERWLMKREDEEWRWCGSESPESITQSDPTPTTIAPSPEVEEEEQVDAPTSEPESTAETTGQTSIDTAQSPLAGLWSDNERNTVILFANKRAYFNDFPENAFEYELFEDGLLKFSMVDKEGGDSPLEFESETEMVDENTLVLQKFDLGEDLVLNKNAVPTIENRTEYDMLYPFGGENWGDPCGYIDHQGNIVIEREYFECHEFSEGLAKVVPFEFAPFLYGYIGLTGNFVIEPKFIYANDFSEGLASVQDLDTDHGPFIGASGYIDKKGGFVIPPAYTSASDFSDGLAYVSNYETGFRGFIDRNGNVVFEIPDFLKGSVASNSKFSDGLLFVDGGYLDKTGQFIAGEHLYFSEGLAFVQEGDSGDCYYINDQNEIVIQTPYVRCRTFSEGMAAIYSADYDPWKCGYIGKSGDLVVDIQFDGCMGFSESRAHVQKGDLWGYINEHGNYIVEPSLDWALGFKNGLALISKDGETGYIDRDGNIIFSYTP